MLEKYLLNDSEIFNLSDIVLILTINSLRKPDLSLSLPMAPLTIDQVFFYVEFVFINKSMVIIYFHDTL